MKEKGKGGVSMAGGHRAEGFPSHIEYLKPPRKKKRKMQSPEDNLYKGRVLVKLKGGSRKKAMECQFFNKIDNHCYKKIGTKYCSFLRGIYDEDCVKQKRG